MQLRKLSLRKKGKCHDQGQSAVKGRGRGMREIAFTIIDSLLPLLHSSLLLKRSLGTDRLTKWLQFPCFINNLMEEVHLSEKTNRRMGLVFPLPLWPPRASLVLGPPTWTRGGWASNSEFPPSSGPPGHMNFLGPNQVLG